MLTLRHRVGALASHIGARLLDCIDVPRCASCDDELPGATVFCATCAHAVLEYSGPRPDGVRAASELGGPIAAAIHRLKYDDRPDLARPLAALLARHIPNDVTIDVVVPVPLHPRRLAQRRYNQSALIARHVGRLRGWPTSMLALRRVRDTQSQTTLARSARLTNLIGAFAASRRLKGKRVLIVDDVTTTGATLAACKRACEDVGCRQIERAAVAFTSA
jgi:ComF family protein